MSVDFSGFGRRDDLERSLSDGGLEAPLDAIRGARRVRSFAIGPGRLTGQFGTHRHRRAGMTGLRPIPSFEALAGAPQSRRSLAVRLSSG